MPTAHNELTYYDPLLVNSPQRNKVAAEGSDQPSASLLALVPPPSRHLAGASDRRSAGGSELRRGFILATAALVRGPEQ